jgi:hypothetical protein
MFGPSDIECPVCRRRRETAQKRTLIRHRDRKAFFEAKRDAILSGKVVVLTQRDEITGLFYRYNKHGQMVILGNGYNRGA